MNFCSLPDEMITNVFKFTNFGKIRLLRRMNKRIDQIARRRKLTRIPLDHLVIEGCSIHLRTEKPLLEIYEDGTKELVFEKIYARNRPALLKLIEKMFPNIKLNKSLTLDDLTFDDQLLQTIERCQPDIRSISSLNLAYVNFALSAEKAKQFVTMCPNLNTMWIHGCNGDIDNFINEKALGIRAWKSFWLKELETGSMEIEFLQQVAAVSKQFSVDFHLFSVSEIIDLLQKLSMDGICDRRIDIGKCLTPTLRWTEMKQLFEKSIPGLLLSHENYCIKMRFDHWREDAYVKFHISG